MSYSKKIKSTDTGMVIVEIHNINGIDINGTRCSLKFFSSVFDTQKALEKKFKRAHKWADERIKILEKGEFNL